MAERFSLAGVMMFLSVLCGRGSQIVAGGASENRVVTSSSAGGLEQLRDDREILTEAGEVPGTTGSAESSANTLSRTTPERETDVVGPDSSVDEQVPPAEQEPTEEQVRSPEQE